jgi:hypothetical protein
MATTKDIRITFFYSDEAIFDLVKNWNTRIRLVKWANEFYARYGFKIDEFPYPWNEAKYKKDFCLQKANGLKVLYTNNDRELTIEKIKNKEELGRINKILSSVDYSSDLDSEFQKNLKLKIAALEYKSELEDLENLLAIRRPTEFRKLLLAKLKQTKSNVTNRVIVIFCEFEDVLLSKYGIKGDVLATTYPLTHLDLCLFLYNILAPESEELFLGVIVLIDINRMTKKYEYVLAHEIVHAAGNTTADNKGTKGNIMIYADAEGKAPTNVNLEPNDKARLDVAYFVV